METRISEIIKRKGDTIVTSVPGQSVESLACQLHSHNIGGTPVLDDKGRVIGMATERDIIRGLVERGGQVLSDPVSSVMTPLISTCSLEDSIGDVLELITRNRTRHVPVLNDGKLAGMVSIGDIVTQLLIEAEHEVHSLRHYILSP